MIKFPVKYINGNYNVTIKPDGTKIKYTDDGEFKPTRPETIDINISDYCIHGCKFCYMDATPNGKFGNLDHELFNSIPEYCEIAINYCPQHIDLYNFLIRMQDKNIIVNMTANQIDFSKYFATLKQMQDNKLIYGLGISINNINNKTKNNLKKYIKYFDNIVIHTVAGVTSMETYEYINTLHNKILILGYKTKGRGKLFKPNFDDFNINKLFRMFDIVSFDNLALDQLDIKNVVSEKVWDKHYMGEDGDFSFYIDTVKEMYYKSSTEENGFLINNKTVKEMHNEFNKN